MRRQEPLIAGEPSGAVSAARCSTGESASSRAAAVSISSASLAEMVALVAGAPYGIVGTTSRRAFLAERTVSGRDSNGLGVAGAIATNASSAPNDLDAIKECVNGPRPTKPDGKSRLTLTMYVPRS